MPSRIVLAEPVARGASRADVETVYAVASDCGEAWPLPAMVTVRGGSVVIVCREPDGSERFEDALAAAMTARLPRLAVNVAAGTGCDSLPGYRDSYTAARRGLDLLRVMGRSGSVFSFRDAGVDHLLLRTTEPEMVVEFASRYVDPLIDYDRTHSSQLHKSLTVFYATGMNLEETARRLHIHVSTLRYRLTRISDLLGADIRGNERLDIELALRADKILASLRR